MATAIDRGSASRLDRRQFLKLSGLGAAGVLVAGSDRLPLLESVSANEPGPPPFTMQDGNAPIQVIIPAAIPVIFGTVSPHASDATVVLRMTTMIANAWFDAIAPYHATAVGVYSSIPRRPENENTNENLNIATLYASYLVMNSLLPGSAAAWQAMLVNVGLDPGDSSTDLTTPVGIGNVAGASVAAARENDGMNQLGNEGGIDFHRRPYADYLGYRPVNSAYQLTNPTRWQPDTLTTGTGLFQVQQFVTPQMSVTQTYTGLNLNEFRAQPPTQSMNAVQPKYKQQVDEVLAASASMTDHQKMMAELFDNKLFSIGLSALLIFGSQELSYHQFVQYDFLVNLAAFDTAIVVWKEKVRFDAVRPFSAIRHVYGGQHVTAWGGPGRGTVSNLPANQWRSYLQTADHPEYPSGSAAFCAAHTQASRHFLGSDVLGWTIPQPQGSSRIEPGVTPATDIALHWDTWTEFEADCGLSRFWSGVHFLPSIPSGAGLGKKVGDRAYDFVKAHIDGEI